MVTFLKNPSHWDIHSRMRLKLHLLRTTPPVQVYSCYWQSWRYYCPCFRDQHLSHRKLPRLLSQRGLLSASAIAVGSSVIIILPAMALSMLCWSHIFFFVILGAYYSDAYNLEYLPIISNAYSNGLVMLIMPVPFWIRRRMSSCREHQRAGWLS